MTHSGTIPSFQRAHGQAHGAFRIGGAHSGLADLHQQGSARLMLLPDRGAAAEAVFLNTSGGLTGGDTLAFSLELHPGARVLATTQTAERAYQSRTGAAQLTMTARVAAGARLDWLPQETILFQDSHLHRQTEIDLSGDAACLTCEGVVLGRAAMDEVVTRCRLRDHRMIRRNGLPVWAETLELTPDTLSPRPVLLDGARAVGIVALVAPGAEDAGTMPQVAGARIAASGWDGRMLVRIRAEGGLQLRRQMAAVIEKLSGRAMPRVWASGGL